MKLINSGLWAEIERRFLPAYAWESDILTLWRERIIMVIVLTAAVLGPISLIPSLTLSYIERRWDIFVLGLISYLLVLVVLIGRNQALRFKAWICFWILYLLGMGLILNLGPFGAGYIWLFGASIMAAAMIGFRAALFSLALNFATLAGIAVLISIDAFSWSLDSGFSLKVWLVVTANFMLVNAMATLITAVLLGGLKRALAAEKQFSDDLRRMEERFRLIVEHLPVMIVGYGTDNNVTLWNRECQRVTGFTAEETALSPENVLVLDAEEQTSQTSIARWMIEAEHFQDKDMAVKCRDGSIRIISWTNMSDIFTIPGLSRWVVGRDITEAKRTQMDLEASEEKHRTILEKMEEGYYEVDLEGSLTFFNKGLVAILGYPEKEMEGLNYREIMDEATIEEAYRVFLDVYNTGKAASAVDWVLIDKDGLTRNVETSISLIRDASGEPVGFRGVARDVTRRKELLEAQKKSFEAEAASQAKTDFLARMSHEIRTPLNAIIGMAELALSDELTESQEKIMDIINNEARALMTLVNRILDFSKIEAQKLDLENIPFELAYLLEDISEGIAVEAHKKSLEFILYISPNVPTRLIGDPGRIRQILTNLLGNAVKFTGKGEVYLKVEAVKQSSADVVLKFSIKDTGIGISEEKQKIIFEPFTQADGSTTRYYGGTGLGTTVSKKLVELMGGELSVESEEGRGSTFMFTAGLTLQPDEQSVSAVPATSTVGKRIMVVDENQTYRRVASSYLQAWGCIVEEASHLEEAVSFLRELPKNEERIDLLLVDIQHFDQDGVELAKAIRAVPELAEIQVIVLARVGRLGDGSRWRDAGVQGYLAKPIRRDDLLQVIRLALGDTEVSGPERNRGFYTKHVLPESERARINILLVEDYPTNQLIATEHLTNAGYRVELAQNGLEAVEAFQRRRFDLILMDIQMPIMDGYEATRQIRNIEFKMQERKGEGSSDGHIPIIALTAHAFKGYRRKCLDAGMDDYLTKPLLRAELLETVEKWSLKAMKSPGDLITSDVEFEVDEAWRNPVESDIMELNRGNPSDEPPISLEGVIEEFMGKKSLVQKAINQFIITVEKQIVLLDEAIEAGNSDAVNSEAHSIKGGAANLTAGRLSSAAKALETAGRTGRLEKGRELLKALEDEFDQLKKYLLDSGAIE